jgi:hypothetical protein
MYCKNLFVHADQYSGFLPGKLSIRIALDWDYVNRTVDISMPGYIKKKIQEYGKPLPKPDAKMPILALSQKVWFQSASPPPNQ